MRANRLAFELMARGVGPEQLVGLLLPRSVDLIMALLAIRKAGAAYLPLDPDHPAERLAGMLDDATPALVLTTRDAAPHLRDSSAEYILLDHPDVLTSIAARPVTNPRDEDRTYARSPLDPAYVIYTSGSTGRPKGVIITQGNLSNFMAAMQARFRLGAADRFLAVTTIGFDIAGLELYFASRQWCARHPAVALRHPASTFAGPADRRRRRQYPPGDTGAVANVAEP